MNATLIRSDVVRYLRSPESLFFTIGLPVLMYIVFGGTAEYGDEPIGYGNINMAVLLNTTIYAVAVAAVGYTGTATIERLQGWGRQLALTPLTHTTRLINRVLSAFLICTITLVVLQVVGYAMGAELPLPRLLAACALCYLATFMFACYGLAVANLFKAETAVSISTGFLVLFAFGGNLFVPLSGKLLTIAQFTPMWGIGELTRYPLTEGKMYDNTGTLSETPLWYSLVSVAVWLIIFVVLAAYTSRRAQER